MWDAPFGLPGVETTLPLLLDGVCQGYLSWERLVDLTALQPAKLYGLYPRKGALSPGSDADVVLVDPQAKYTFRDERVVSKAGWTPFAGRTVTGLPTHTFVRGRLVAESGRPVGEPGWGQFLAGRGRVDR